MRFSVQADNFKMLKGAVNSNCDGVRFGSEFCEYKMPTLETLRRAYELAHAASKSFEYVTPIVSNSGIEEIRKQLALLNDIGDVKIVFNDLGVLNILKNYPNLSPHLGREAFQVLSRSPWTENVIKQGGLLGRGWFTKLFSTTSLNYPSMIGLLRTYGVGAVDVDWIPRTFPSFDFLIREGISLSVHCHLVPVTVTRKCHTARFLGEQKPEECSKPCFEKAYMLKNEMFDLKLFLWGNTVFTGVDPSQEDLRKMKEKNVAEFVLTMNAITGIDSEKKIDDAIISLTI